jgi:hypothetical protein
MEAVLDSLKDPHTYGRMLLLALFYVWGFHTGRKSARRS